MHFFRRAIAALLALFLAVPATAAPALWKFGDADTTIYLFGTIHALPDHLVWRDARIESAIAKADTLVLETPVNNNAAEVAAYFPKPDPSLPPLLDRLPVKSRPAMIAVLNKAGIPLNALDRLQTWHASFILMGAMMKDIGADRAAGVEQVLTPVFTATPTRSIEALETAPQQLALFAGLSEGDQREFLTSMVDGRGSAKKDYAAMVRAWGKGDDAALARAFDKDEDLSPHLRDILLEKRNRAWTEWLKARLDKPGTVFVAVGAGHLAGPLSVQKMLAAQGIRVERVR